MFLYINTAIDNIIELALVDKDGTTEEKLIKEAGRLQSEKLMPLIVSFLGGRNFLFKDLKGIIVVSGPGRFTSLRIGIATGNTMAFSLTIPIVGIMLHDNLDDIDFKKAVRKMKKGVYVMPTYGREPNITKPKKK